MKKIFLSGVILMLLILSFGCETPESTLHEASQDLQRGISGQGHLEERSWDEVEAF